MEEIGERVTSEKMRSLARDVRSRLDQLRVVDPQSKSWAAAIVQLGSSRTELGKAIAEFVEAVDQRQTAELTNHEQNEMLLSLLALFVILQILALEYRWMVKPIVRMAAVLNAGEHSWRDLADYLPRRDEIGVFARALVSHFKLARAQQEMAGQAQAALSERVARQEGLRQEGMSFQACIAGIVQNLEEHAGRMSKASEHLVSISSEADARAGASARSTRNVSEHVDTVASSVNDIGTTLTEVAVDAEKTSAVATAARSLVVEAQGDVAALSEAARAIEPVIALIEDVANQTNLLALNATIEAARAGEMGRGFGVVAHEVKQLASRTARATEDVRSGLQGITAASARIAERVARLVESIEQVDAVASTIAESTRRQEVNSQSITSSTARVAADVRDVAATVKEVADIIAEARAAADQVTKASTDLGQQAADLRTAVVRFVETTERIAA
jgi:methyl-accepting chemotaxis protein